MSCLCLHCPCPGQSLLSALSRTLITLSSLPYAELRGLEGIFVVQIHKKSVAARQHNLYSHQEVAGLPDSLALPEALSVNIDTSECLQRRDVPSVTPCLIKRLRCPNQFSPLQDGFHRINSHLRQALRRPHIVADFARECTAIGLRSNACRAHFLWEEVDGQSNEVECITKRGVGQVYGCCNLCVRDDLLARGWTCTGHQG